MRLSTKGRVAVTALIDIASRQAFGPVSLADIASRQQISISYLEQLFSKLRLQGLVISTRGSHGGYALGRRTEDITVTDIILAVDDVFPTAIQPGAAPEQDISKYLWDTLSAKILDFTQSVTLKSLVIDQQAKKIELQPLPSQGLFRAPLQPFNRPNVPNGVAALGQPF